MGKKFCYSKNSYYLCTEKKQIQVINNKKAKKELWIKQK